MVMGEVVALFVKPAKAAPMAAARVAGLVEGVGVEGDCNADRRSARQILVVHDRAARSLGAGPGDLRENITVAGLDVDALSSGTELRIGPARVRLTYPCEPCVRLRALTGIQPRAAVGARGVLGVVTRSGVVHRGAAVEAAPGRYAELPAERKDRARWFVERIPAGRVVTYGQLAGVVAAPPGGVRFLPRLLAGLAAEGLPVHRVVPADLRRVVRAQQALLEKEGVDVRGDRPAGGWWGLESLLYERPATIQKRAS